MREQDSSVSQSTPEMTMLSAHDAGLEQLLASFDLNELDEYVGRNDNSLGTCEPARDIMHDGLDEYVGRSGNSLGACEPACDMNNDGLDLMIKRDLEQMEQNQRLLDDNRSYNVLVGQLKGQLMRYQSKYNKQAREIAQLQHQLALKKVLDEQKFNQCLVFANHYEQSKNKEIEALKLELVQQEHVMNTLLFSRPTSGTSRTACSSAARRRAFNCKSPPSRVHRK